MQILKVGKPGCMKCVILENKLKALNLVEGKDYYNILPKDAKAMNIDIVSYPVLLKMDNNVVVERIDGIRTEETLKLFFDESII